MIRNASSACTVTARLAGMAVAFAVAVGLLGASLPARSQGSGMPTLPGLSKLANSGPPGIAASAAGTATSSLNPDKERERLNSELVEVRGWNDQLSDGDTPAAVPVGISKDEIAQAVRKLTQWAIANEGSLRALAGIQTARAELAAIHALESAWSGPGGKPPYSILMVDDWARDAESRRIKIASMEATNRMGERELVRLGEASKQAGSAVRRLEEAARTAKVPDQAAAAWRVKAAQWAEKAEGATLAAIANDRQWTTDKIAVEQAQLGLLTRKLGAVAGQVSFTTEDLEQIRRIEQTRRAHLEKESVQATAAVQQRTREFEAATLALERLRSAQPPASQEALDVAEARHRAARTALETSRRDIEMLANLESLTTASVGLWKLRFDALNATDADRRREATAALRKGLEDTRVWKTYASGQIAVVQSELGEQAIRRERLGQSPEVVRYEAAATESLNLRALRMQQLEDEIDRVDRALRRWVDEIGGTVRELPWSERAALAWSQIRSAARSVWQFELFSVEDTVELQGQKVSVSRGVTVGKSVGAALLFIFGYLIAGRLARRLERTLTRHFGVDPAQARTVRRWSLTLVGFILLVLTLNLAQIPLTVFAFMGGALAIGVGFGTQTIIKNFISGLILLMERQIRVGDIVDIDGTTGTVTEVNLRSSTIKSFDGVAAIVPNSTLLEGKVTNWTMSDPKVRRIVRVGVAYGSPTDEVARRMLECAQRHGLVVKSPEPQVMFEDFGDSNLVFGLYFWIDVQAGTSGQVVMSDLRFMIEKSFAEGGISMAFPQRDVHLDATRPLQVELTRRAADHPADAS
ncbi:mechanosensitive ion channel domain-containing protein [Candidatus Skiveiella danica]|uniref:mechanosensitive ion channel domain-containing protein n=1 Tax=Candidatus Skiveiella danica TaxID=3386177 RepID=UPI001D2F964E|nr:mechanosensitive ion channel [Betaproteobacteria bacterium]